MNIGDCFENNDNCVALSTESIKKDNCKSLEVKYLLLKKSWLMNVIKVKHW